MEQGCLNQGIYALGGVAEAVLARGPSSAVVCAAAAPARDVTGSPRSVLQSYG